MPPPTNRAPVADLQLLTPLPICVGQEVVVDASGTTDVDGPPNKTKNVFHWGQSTDKTTAPGKPGKASYPRGYNAVGVYDIVYEVIDHKGLKDTATITIDVQPAGTQPVPVDCVLGEAVETTGEWGACQTDGTQTRTVTWTKAILTPPAHGGAECGPTSGSRVETQTCVYVPPVEPPPSGVLAPSDLRYLGMLRTPLDAPEVRVAWSAGAMACRTVDGETRLFLTASALNGDEVYEVRVPATFGADVASAPRAEMVRVWGDIYEAKRIPTTDRTETRGLLWADDTLWWAYGRYYNVAGIHDPSVGCTVLDDATGGMTAYGPWKTNEHSQKTRGYLVDLPSGMAVGAPPTSGNANSPMGSWLSQLPAFDPLTTPPNTTLTCENVLAHDLQHPQARPAGSRYVACHEGASSTDPTFRNAVAGGYLAYNMITAAAWVQTETRKGLVMVGQIADVVPGMTYNVDTVPHMWYGPSNNAGPDSVCSHGQRATIGVGTGPKCGSMVPYLWIYDESAEEAHCVPLASIAPTVNYPCKDDYALGGACFDPVRRLLFLAEINADVLTNHYEPRPVIHVFEVA